MSTVAADQKRGYLGLKNLDLPNPSACSNDTMEDVAVTFLALMVIIAVWSSELVRTEETLYRASLQTRQSIVSRVKPLVGSFLGFVDSTFRFVAFLLISVFIDRADPTKDTSEAFPYNTTAFVPNDVRSFCFMELDQETSALSPYNSSSMTALAVAAMALTGIEMMVRGVELLERLFIEKEDQQMCTLFLTKKLHGYPLDFVRLHGAFSRAVAGLFMFGFIVANSIWTCPPYKSGQLYRTTMFFLFAVPCIGFVQILRVSHMSKVARAE